MVKEYRFFELYRGMGINSTLEKYVIIKEEENNRLNSETFSVSKEKSFKNRIQEIYPDIVKIGEDGKEYKTKHPKNVILRGYINNTQINKDGYYKQMINDQSSYVFYQLNLEYQHKFRNQWMKDKHVFDRYLNLKNESESLYNFIHNIYGDNTELFLDNMAYRLGEYKKQKVLFMIGSKERYIGKGQSMDLLMRTFSGDEDEFNEPDNRIIKIEGGKKWIEAETKDLILVVNEQFLSTKFKLGDVLAFDKIKELQAADGGLVEGKGKTQKNIRNPLLMTFNTFNVDINNLNEKFYIDQSPDYIDYVFYTNNKEATGSNPYFRSAEWLNYLNTEAPIVLAKHLLARHTYMMENDMERFNLVSNDKEFCKASKYDINEINFEKWERQTKNIYYSINSCLFRYVFNRDIEEFRTQIRTYLNIEDDNYYKDAQNEVTYGEWSWIGQQLPETIIKKDSNPVKMKLQTGMFGSKCNRNDKLIPDAKEKVIKLFESPNTKWMGEIYREIYEENDFNEDYNDKNAQNADELGWD